VAGSRDWCEDVPARWGEPVPGAVVEPARPSILAVVARRGRVVASEEVTERSVECGRTGEESIQAL